MFLSLIVSNNEVRVRLSFGFSDVHTLHVHAITGTPCEVPVPKNVAFNCDMFQYTALLLKNPLRSIVLIHLNQTVGAIVIRMIVIFRTIFSRVRTNQWFYFKYVKPVNII